MVLLSDKVVVLFHMAYFVCHLGPLFSNISEKDLLLQHNGSITLNDLNMLGNLDHQFFSAFFCCVCLFKTYLKCLNQQLHAGKRSTQ